MRDLDVMLLILDFAVSQANEVTLLLFLEGDQWEIAFGSLNGWDESISCRTRPADRMNAQQQQ